MGGACKSVGLGFRCMRVSSTSNHRHSFQNSVTRGPHYCVSLTFSSAANDRIGHGFVLGPTCVARSGRHIASSVFQKMAVSAGVWHMDPEPSTLVTGAGSAGMWLDEKGSEFGDKWLGLVAVEGGKAPATPSMKPFLAVSPTPYNLPHKIGTTLNPNALPLVVPSR